MTERECFPLPPGNDRNLPALTNAGADAAGSKTMRPRYVVGWIVRTEAPGRTRYWRVVERYPDRAVDIAREAAAADEADPLSKIVDASPVQLGQASGKAVELWPRRESPPSHRRASALCGEITFDTMVRDEGQPHVEGCYRLDGEDWKVFYFTQSWEGEEWAGPLTVERDAVFSSGVPGMIGIVPTRTPLNKDYIKRILARFLGVGRWDEVRGPDSLILK